MKGFTVVRDDYPVAQTEQGKIRGLELDGVLTFRGIPYAKAERFGAPQKPDAWDGIRECYTWGDVAPQNEPTSSLFSSHRWWPKSENCMNLNIWTKDLNPSVKKPVMFWIHGGGYFSGSSIDEEITEGDGLAKTGEVVVVSINHRLYSIGYLDLRDFPGFEHSANAGHEDLIAALQWVHDNIANFGGDPNNVTIFGQSGGGGKVMSLMQMKAADGLYHKAIIQSGAVGGGKPQDEALFREVGRRTVANLGLTAETVEQIRTVPLNDLIEASEKAAKEMGGLMRDYSRPHPDGSYLLDNYMVDGFRPEALNVPIMVGSCIAEGYLFSPDGLKPRLFSESDIQNFSKEQKIEKLRSKFPENADKVYELMEKIYPKMDPMMALEMDFGSRRNAQALAAARAKAGAAPAYNYLFAYVVPVLEGKPAWHGADLGFTFRNLDHSEVLRAGGFNAYALMEKMSDAWIAFARTGNPNHCTIPEWKPYSEEEKNCMFFDVNCYAKDGLDEALLDELSKQARPRWM